MEEEEEEEEKEEVFTRGVSKKDASITEEGLVLLCQSSSQKKNQSPIN